MQSSFINIYGPTCILKNQECAMSPLVRQSAVWNVAGVKDY